MWCLGSARVRTDRRSSWPTGPTRREAASEDVNIEGRGEARPPKKPPPVKRGLDSDHQHRRQQIMWQLAVVEEPEFFAAKQIYDSDDRPHPGAASFLLHPQVQEHIPALVLEGAPGQGKSTIAQYVCQVHRMRLLQEEEVLNSIPKAHRESPIRLPIKVDLR